MKTLLPSNDPLGQAITEYWNTGINRNILIRSGIIANETLPPSYFFREYDEMPELEKHALQQCTGKVLDIGAGAGCHSLYLQQQGVAVTALEISQLACQVMQEQGINNIINQPIEEHNSTTYDTLLLLMNGIGIAGSLEHLAKLLKHLKTLLKPQGQIIFDSSDIKNIFEQDDGSLLMNLNQRYYGEIDYQLQYKKTIGQRFFWLFVDRNKACQAATSAGFQTEVLKEGDQGAYLMRLW